MRAYSHVSLSTLISCRSASSRVSDSRSSRFIWLSSTSPSVTLSSVYLCCRGFLCLYLACRFAAEEESLLDRDSTGYVLPLLVTSLWREKVSTPWCSFSGELVCTPSVLTEARGFVSGVWVCLLAYMLIALMGSPSERACQSVWERERTSVHFCLDTEQSPESLSSGNIK